MKVNNFADKKNGLEGAQEDIVMGIDSDNHLTLLNSLTHLYSNPVLAAFREYCANAADAHKDSGQKKPFEVNFSYRYDGKPNLRIRDYGKGMTKEQITKVYSQYGASTKANNNAQVGGFGLGSKSGLAVSNHLFVNTVSNGVLIKAQILKNKENKSVIRILSEEPTKAPSGTEIILPVTGKQLRQLLDHAEEELVGYKPEQVLLNGNPLTYTVHDKDQFIPVILGTNTIAYIARNDMRKQNTYGLNRHSTETLKANYSVIMGGVYYPSLPSLGSVDTADKEFFDIAVKLNKRFENSPKIILNIPVGSVDLPPHRDSIIDTEKTWATLKGLFANLNMGLESSLDVYLNALSLREASRVVASMRALFSPKEKWTHRGKEYDNDMSRVMSTMPFLYTHISHYYGTGSTRFAGRVEADACTVLQLRVNSHEYNYQHRGKTKIVVVNLCAEQDKWEEIVKWDANERADWRVKVKMNKPRINAFMTRYLNAVIEEKYGTEEYYVVVTPKGAAIPEHFKGAIDATVTEELVKAEYRKLFPPQPKKAVQQKHCRVTKEKMEYSLIFSNEKIVYFGGKDSYGTEKFMGENIQLPQVAMMKKVSTGAVDDTREFAWAYDGLLNLLEDGTSLVAVGSTRATGNFTKTFKEAVPLGEVVMKFYDNLDADRKLAVQHAFSIFSLWHITDPLFSILGGKHYPMANRSIELMFKEPELVSVAHYLFAFKDSYVENLVEWKKDFVEDMKNKELAWKMLLPVQSLINDIHINSSGNPPADGVYHTRLPLRCANQLHVDALAGWVDKLTTN